MKIHLLKNTKKYSMSKKKHKIHKRKLNNSHGLRDPVANLVVKNWIKYNLPK